MSIHLGAKGEDIAPRVLLPGDPLRARFVAERFFHNAYCYNEVRGMLGFTGTYKGVRVSVQGTGMGLPSHSIYVTELFQDYGVQKVIRVGTAGGLQEEVALKSVVCALGAATDSAINARRFSGMHFAPTASWSLLRTAVSVADEMGTGVQVGNVISSDVFYDESGSWRLWARYGVLAVEMETAELYTLAAKFRREALSILTISDHLVTGAVTSAQERERSFTQMIEIALEAIIQ